MNSLTEDTDRNNGATSSVDTAKPVSSLTGSVLNCLSQIKWVLLALVISCSAVFLLSVINSCLAQYRGGDTKSNSNIIEATTLAAQLRDPESFHLWLEENNLSQCSEQLREAGTCLNIKYLRVSSFPLSHAVFSNSVHAASNYIFALCPYLYQGVG